MNHSQLGLSSIRDESNPNVTDISPKRMLKDFKYMGDKKQS